MRPSIMFRLVLGLFLASLALGLAGFAFGEDAAKAHVAVVRFSNDTSSSSYDAACKAATDTLFMTLQELGRYRVQLEEGAGAGEEALRAMAAERQLDFIMYGKITKAESGGIDCKLSVFDRAKGKTTLSQTKKAAGVLDVFDAADDLVVSVLESLTGAHIGFGSLKLTNIGEKGSYAVLVDGSPVGNDLASLDRVLIGKRWVTIAQKRMLGDREIAKASVEMKEGGTAEMSFALPLLMDDEKRKVEGLRAAIDAGWNEASKASDVEAKIAELSSLLGDISYSPGLAKYKDGAKQLSGEWALRKNRLAIEKSAWDPKVELLDGVGAIYAGAKAYPDPEKIRRGFTDNARLVATLLELKAGKALAGDDMDTGLECYEGALMLSTRYLGGARLTDYAYAVTTLKDIQEKASGSKAGGGGDKDLRAVFSVSMLAAQRFYGLKEEVEGGKASALVASDFATSVSVDGGDFQEAPLALPTTSGSRSMSIQPKGAKGPIALTVPAGTKLLFVQDGAAPFGKVTTEAASAPAATAPAALISINRPTGSLSVGVVTEGTLYLDGIAMGEMPSGGKAKLNFLEIGERSLEMRYVDGQTEKKSVTIVGDKTATVTFMYGSSPP